MTDTPDSRVKCPHNDCSTSSQSPASAAVHLRNDHNHSIRAAKVALEKQNSYDAPNESVTG